MRELLTMAMEAHSEERNHHRRYEITVGTDVLNHWVVIVRFGRVGQALQEIQFADPDVDAAKRIVARCLRRRLSAPRRIGCAYRFVGLPEHHDAGWQDWLQTLVERGPLADAIDGDSLEPAQERGRAWTESPDPFLGS